MIDVASWADVPPLGEFRICPYLIQVLRCVLAAEEIPEDDLENLDIWLAPLNLGEHEINPEDHRLRLCFMIGHRVLCRIPYRVLYHAQPTFLARVN
jgi:hypothetical protein